MRLASLTLPCLAVAALAAACTKSNPDFCGSDPCPPDAPPAIDGMTGCTANPGICTGEASTCLNDECVDCGTAANLESADCTVAASPVCGADHACRPCAADAECTSGVCEGGTCIAAADIVYVEQGATDNAQCSQAMPCASPSHGMTLIGGSRRHMIIAASASAYQVDPLTISTDVTIRGTGAILERNAGNQVVDITAGTVSITGLKVRLSAGGGGADGIKCAAATLRLRQVTLEDNDDRGLDTNNCIVDVTQSVFSGNKVSGIRIVDGRASIRNSFFFNNGSNTAAAGGLSLNPNTTPNLIEFNTIVKNKAANNANSAGGIVCATGSAAIIARNNLVYESVMASEVLGSSCTHSYSVIGSANPPAGTMVRSMTRAEVGLANLDGTTLADYRLTGSSMLRGAADPAPSPAADGVDYDGQPRPNPTGMPADIGADEIQ